MPSAPKTRWWPHRPGWFDPGMLLTPLLQFSSWHLTEGANHAIARDLLAREPSTRGLPRKEIR